MLRLTRNSHSRIWMIASGALPRKPPEPWWIMIRLFGQGVPLAGGAGREQDRRHGRRHADADRADRGPQVLHGVVDREAGVHDAAGRVDVQADVLLRVLGLEEQQLGDDQVRQVVLDRVTEEDDPLAEQARVDVVRAFPTTGGFDDHRDEHRGSPLRSVGHGLASGGAGALLALLAGGRGSGRLVAVVVVVVVADASGIAPGSVASMAAFASAWGASTADGASSSRCGRAGCSGWAASQRSTRISTSRVRRRVLRMKLRPRSDSK